MRIESLHDALAFFPDIDGFWNGHSLAESESQILSLLPPPGETGSDARATERLTQLARIQGLQGDFDKAKATLDLASQWMAKGLTDPRAEVRWLLEKGRILCLSMSPAKAHDVFAQAWTLANENHLTYFAVDAALMLSTVRPPKYQNEWLQKALTLAESSEDKQVRLWLSQLLFLEGWHACDFRQFDRSLQCFEKAMSQPRATDENWRLMAMQWSRGRVLRALGHTDQALELQKTLLKEMGFKGRVSGHVYLEIAECLQLLKQTELARTNFELAYGELSVDGWYADNRVDELARMKYLFKKR